MGCLEKDTSSLGLTGMVVHPSLEFSGGEGFTELMFTVRAILVFGIKSVCLKVSG